MRNTHGRHTAIQMGGVLTVFPFPQRMRCTERTTIQSGGVLQYNCWRCSAALFGEVVVVSVVTRPKYLPYRETGVAIPLSHCVSCSIADYR